MFCYMSVYRLYVPADILGDKPQDHLTTWHGLAAVPAYPPTSMMLTVQ